MKYCLEDDRHAGDRLEDTLRNENRLESKLFNNIRLGLNQELWSEYLLESEKFWSARMSLRYLS